VQELSFAKSWPIAQVDTSKIDQRYHPWQSHLPQYNDE